MFLSFVDCGVFISQDHSVFVTMKRLHQLKIILVQPFGFRDKSSFSRSGSLVPGIL